MSQVPANTSDFQFANTGLEDFGVSDAVLPRLKINGKEGTWVDNTGGTPMPELFFIPLGLVKQRVLFHHNVEDGDVPMCKSSDFATGFPNPEAPAKKSFPWDLAGFDPNDFPADQGGNRKLPCNSCALKDWGSSPTGDTPYCAEQWTMPVFYYPDGPESGDKQPAILSLQKSAVKAIRSYLTSFAGANKPPFVNLAKGTLKVLQRGQVTYSVPSFTKLGETDRSEWLDFSNQYVEMRNFLVRPPVREEESGTPAEADNSYSPAPAAQVVQPAAPVQQAAPVAQQPVAQQPPAQQAAPATDPWTGQNAAPVAQQPVTPTEPVAEPVAQQPPAQPAAPAAPTPPAAGGLPF